MISSQFTFPTWFSWFPIGFFSSMPFPSAPPSKLHWLHQFLGNSRDWSYWRRHQCTAMSTPPVAEPNLATQEFLSLIWQKSYRNWCPIFKNLSNPYTQIETCSPSIITQVSYPLQPPEHPGFLQPTSDAPSRLRDFHQQATEEDNQWKHWRHQGGDKADSGTILERDVPPKNQNQPRCLSSTDLVLFSSVFL